MPNSSPTPLRVAVSPLVPKACLAHIPASVEIVHYSLDGDDTHVVDMLVPPSFGKQAADVLPRIQTRYIQTISAGVETIQPLVPPGVVLCNAQGVHDAATAEWTVTAILGALKWLPLYARQQAAEQWVTRATLDSEYQAIHGEPNTTGNVVMVDELEGKHILIAGYGSIGKAIEARLISFNPGSITRLARTARGEVFGVDSLDDLLPKADVVVVIVPLTAETTGLFGATQFAKMRRGALLVNAARGPVVDTDALVAALESRHIRAALDVTAPEPLPDRHPLWRAPGLLLTPHVAGSSPLFLDKVFRFVGAQLERLQQGLEPLNVIRGEY